MGETPRLYAEETSVYYPYGIVVLAMYSAVVLTIGLIAICSRRDKSPDKVGECFALVCGTALLNLIPMVVNHYG